MDGQTSGARKPGARKRHRQGTPPGRILGVVAVVLLIVGIGWGGWAMVGAADDPSGDPAGEDSTSAAGAAASADAHAEHESASAAPAGTSETDSSEADSSWSATEPATEEAGETVGCDETVAAAQEVVGAARTGIDHWSRHVQASVDWGAGRITEERKKAIWKRTRLAGPGDLERYDAALDSYARSAGGCEGAPKTDPCAQRLTALETSMRAGSGAMGDWERHQAHMASYADGNFGAAHANAMWNKAKREAPVNIGKFADAEAVLVRAPSCG